MCSSLLSFGARCSTGTSIVVCCRHFMGVCSYLALFTVKQTRKPTREVLESGSFLSEASSPLGSFAPTSSGHLGFERRFRAKRIQKVTKQLETSLDSKQWPFGGCLYNFVPTAAA